MESTSQLDLLGTDWKRYQLKIFCPSCSGTKPVFVFWSVPGRI